MSQSSLVTKYVGANESNFTYGRQDTIHGIVFHHAATTSLSGVDATFNKYGANASAHYAVRGTEIHQYVNEEDTAWAVGDWAGNCCTISIELVNSVGSPDWLVSEETISTAIKLAADIAKRNSLGKVKFEPDGTYPTLSAHRDWSATYCPGDFIYNRMSEIESRINEINYPTTPTTPELVWTKLDDAKQYECLDNPAYLVDFNCTSTDNLKIVKEYKQGEIVDIYGKCENKTIGKTYLVTEYSFTKKKTNGFRETHMELVEEKPVEPVEPVEPEEPVEPVTPSTDDTPVWFIRFIQALGEFFVSLFKKEK